MNRPISPDAGGRAATAAVPRSFRWALADFPPPPATLALPLAEAVRNAVYRAAARAGIWPLPDAFHGGPGGADDHACWWPEDEDRDGCLDHLTLFAPQGLPPLLLPELARGLTVWLAAEPARRIPALGPWRLLPVAMGPAPATLTGPARRWMPAAPFVPPLWAARAAGGAPRPGRAAEAQLLRDILGAGLPQPEEIRLHGAVAFGERRWRAADFVAVRRETDPVRGGAAGTAPARKLAPPGDAQPLLAELLFAAPVAGPLSFGYGAHFGLGLLVPADTAP